MGPASGGLQAFTRRRKARMGVGYSGTPWSGQAMNWNCRNSRFSLEPFCQGNPQARTAQHGAHLPAAACRGGPGRAGPGVELHTCSPGHLPLQPGCKPSAPRSHPPRPRSAGHSQEDSGLNPSTGVSNALRTLDHGMAKRMTDACILVEMPRSACRPLGCECLPAFLPASVVVTLAQDPLLPEDMERGCRAQRLPVPGKGSWSWAPCRPGPLRQRLVQGEDSRVPCQARARARAAGAVPYLVQGKGPDRVGRQLDRVQQRHLDHPVGFGATAWPVLVALHLRGRRDGRVRVWPFWLGQRGCGTGGCLAPPGLTGTTCRGQQLAGLTGVRASGRLQHQLPRPQTQVLYQPGPARCCLQPRTPRAAWARRLRRAGSSETASPAARAARGTAPAPGERMNGRSLALVMK